MLERIREILSKYQLTPTQFADAIGTARPIVSHILSGRNKPSLEVVQKIISAYPELSLPWLLSGTGPMETDAPSVQPQAGTPGTLSKANSRPTTARVAEKQPAASQEVQTPVAAPIPVAAPPSIKEPVSLNHEPLGGRQLQ
ncbi:helix-turn-helix domain-containing protein [Hymenobacter sp. 5414T-23]|uniref:helix-turn-helix domain-containing protein n=1 Tax=Hymenobacter sp. 5414T-23 TaxID=2932252 RepID=UPI003979C800